MPTAVIVDADDYFRLARAAMMKAQKQISVVKFVKLASAN